jgi:hypothetical protein
MRTKRGRHGAQKVSAAGAAAVCAYWIADVGAKPTAAGFAFRIDALHRETGQILHRFFPGNHRRLQNDRPVGNGPTLELANG